MTPCPTPTMLALAFADLLDAGRADPGLVEHVEVCGDCQSRLESLVATSADSPFGTNELGGNGDSHTSAQGHTMDLDGLPGLRPDSPARLPEVPGYEILGVLGRGGMGVVYKARHEKLNRIVALKMILAGEHADVDKVARFHAEAEAVARLRHPNIVAIHDVGYADGMPYIALEYVPGGSLEQVFSRGPMSFRAAAAMLAPLAQGVHTAHLAGIIHRDLKPANVLLAEDGAAKVTDFGLAKRLETQGQTQTGQIIGTPAYMAPEQARGESKSVGPAADIYALGALLYEMLTGRPPFRGATVLDTLAMVLADEPTPPRKVAPGVPADLETVCLKALRKKPAERYPTAQEFADELNRFLNDEPVRARPLRRVEKAYRWCRRNPTLAGLLVAAAGLLLMVGLAGTLGFYHVQLQEAMAGEEEQRGRAEDALRLANRFLYFHKIHLASQSYQDNQILRARDQLRECPQDQRGWEWNYLYRIIWPGSLSIRGHDQAVETLAFPRHEHWLVSGSSDGTLRMWEPRTGEELMKAADHTAPVWGVAVSPDGRRLASVSGTAGKRGELILWDVTDGPKPRLHVRALGLGGGEHSAVAFHPTRPLLALATGVTAGQSGELLLLDEGGKTIRRWAGAAGSSCVGLAWSSDGRRLAATFLQTESPGASGEVLVFDPEAHEPLHRFPANGGQAVAVAFSPDGRTLATGGADRAIELREAADCTLRTICRGHVSAVTTLAFMPDGRLVSGGKDTTVRVWDALTGKELLVRRGHRGPVSCVVVAPMSGRPFSCCTLMEIRAWRPEQPQEAEEYPLHKGAVTGISFSPDGESLVSIGLDGAVWRIDPTGEHRPRKLRQEARPLRQVRSLPGSQLLAVCGGAAEPGRDDGSVCFLDGRDGQPRGELATGLAVASSLSLSSDGKWLSVLGQTPKRQTEVQVWDLTTRRRKVRLDAANAAAAVVFPSGEKLLVLFATPDGGKLGTHAIHLFDLADDCRRIPFAPTYCKGARFAVFSADESFVLLGEGEMHLRFYHVGGPRQFTSSGTFYAHTGVVVNAALSPDEKQCATASEDESIGLWDLEYRTAKLILRGNQEAVTDVAFSPSGHLLASAFASGTIRVWDGRPTPISASQPDTPRVTR